MISRMTSSRGTSSLRSVTDDEVAAFHRDGAVLIEQVVPSEWIDLLGDGLEAAYARPDTMSVDLEGADRPGVIRIDQFPAARCRPLMDFVTRSPVAEIVGSVLAGPVRFYMDQMFYKPAGEILATAWHQDTPYYNVEGADLVRAWVSPDPTPRPASLEVVRGSHRWNVTYAPRNADGARTYREVASADNRFRYGDAPIDRSLPRVPDVEGHRASVDVIGWDYQPGDVILFAGNILHGAGGQVSLDHPRRAHASLWAGDDVHYVVRAGQVIPDPVALAAHGPRPGQYLSEFPDVFPTIWEPGSDRRRDP